MRPASTARAAVLAACAAGCGLRPGRAYHVAPAVVEGPRLRSTPLDRWERAEEAPAPALGTAREDVDRAAPAIRRLRNGVPVYVSRGTISPPPRSSSASASGVACRRPSRRCTPPPPRTRSAIGRG